MTLISYIIDLNAQEFFFFENNPTGNTAAKAKEIELAEKYGYKELYGTKIPPFSLQLKKLTHYYGTIWLRYKWTETGAVHYAIFGRYKDASLARSEGEKIQKFVLTPYEEYINGPQEPVKELDEATKKAIDAIEHADLLSLFDDDKEKKSKVRKISPGFL